MLFCLAWFFNFLIGGLSGVFLSDVPSDVTTHGSFFSMAHFHYTIMGGLVFTFFAAIYFWVPKMTGFQLNERLGKIHFWTMFVVFNSTFAPLFAAGLPRPAAPRRHLSRTTCSSSTTGCRSPRSCSDSRCCSSSTTSSSRSSSRACRRPRTRGGRSRSSGSCRRPCPSTTSTASRCSPATRTATASPERPPACRQPSPAGGIVVSELAQPATDYGVVEGEPPELLGRNLDSAAHLLASATAFFFLAFLFAYFYLRSLNNAGLWRPKHVDPSLTLGTLVMALTVRERAARPARPRSTIGGRRRRQWRLKGARRARRRARSRSCSSRRVDVDRLRPGGRRLRERLLRLDGVQRPVRRSHAVLARDHARDGVPLPQRSERRAGARARRRATRAGPGTTSATRSRSCGPASSRCPSTGRSSRQARRRHLLDRPLPRLSRSRCGKPGPSAEDARWRVSRTGRRFARPASRRVIAARPQPKLFRRAHGAARPAAAVAPPLIVAAPGRILAPQRLSAVACTRVPSTHPCCVAWTLFVAVDPRIVWHIPGSTTSRCETARCTFGACLFFGTGLLFWGALFDSAPSAPSWWRIAYLDRPACSSAGSSRSCSRSRRPPLYPAYAALPHRPGGLSAIADQQLAAGVMSVPARSPITVAIIVFVYRWLGARVISATPRSSQQER